MAQAVNVQQDLNNDKNLEKLKRDVFQLFWVCFAKVSGCTLHHKKMQAAFSISKQPALYLLLTTQNLPNLRL